MLGNIKHEFIEKFVDRAVESIRVLDTFGSNSIPENIFSTQQIDELIMQIKSRYLESMIIAQLDDEDVCAQLISIIPKVVRWIHEMTPDCLRQLGHKKIIGSVRTVPVTKNDLKTVHTIDELSGIEENVWSPVIGIKGQIDLVVGARNLSIEGSDQVTNYLPVEIKTGKWRPSTVVGHRAQTIIYVLMLLLRDKRQATFPLRQDPMYAYAHPGALHGILVYVNDDGVRFEVVEPSWGEIKALIICRNKFAIDLVHAAQASSRPFPGMLMHSDCERCYSASECILNHAAVEDGDKRSSGVPALFSFITRGLSSTHMEYFKVSQYNHP